MPDNQLELEIDASQAKRALQDLNAEAERVKGNIKSIKDALTDATGATRALLQQSLSNQVAQYGKIQNSLNTAMASGQTGGGGGVVGANSPGIPGLPVTGLPVGNTGNLSAAALLGYQTAAIPGTTFAGVPSSSANWVRIGAGGGGPPLIGYSSGAIGGGSGGGGGALVPYTGGAGGQLSPQQVQQAIAAGTFAALGGQGQPQNINLNAPQNAYLGQTPGWNPFPMRFGPQVNMSAMGLGLGYAGVQGIEGALNYQTQQTLRGGSSSDVMERAGIQGRLIGSAFGAVVGSIGGPLGSIGGAAIFGGLGETWFRNLAAPEAAKQENFTAIRPFYGAFSGGAAYRDSYRLAGNQFGPGMFGPQERENTSRFARIAQGVDKFLPPELQFKNAGAGIGQIYSNVASGLFAGGVDPTQIVGSHTGNIYPLWNEGGRTPQDAIGDAQRALERQRQAIADAQGKHPFGISSARGTVDALAYMAEAAAKMQGQKYSIPDESLAERYTRRLATLFGQDAKEVSKSIAPIFASAPETGGNLADILTRFGPENTSTYLRIQNDTLQSSVDPMVLARTSAAIRGDTRQASLGALLPTGSGRAVRSALQRQMDDIASLPGGRDSLVYAQSYAGMREARTSEFGQETLAGYGLRNLELEGQRSRQEYLPFSPGNRFRTNIGIVVNNRQQIARLTGYLSNNDLSERERFEFSSQLQDLYTQNARSIGEISEGSENRLPALSAGRPAFFGRYSSTQGAARNLGYIGSPVRFAGAVGGRQVQLQEDFVHQFDISGSIGPYSRTSGLNNPGIRPRVPGIAPGGLPVRGQEGALTYPDGARVSVTRGDTTHWDEKTKSFVPNDPAYYPAGTNFNAVHVSSSGGRGSTSTGAAVSGGGSTMSSGSSDTLPVLNRIAATLDALLANSRGGGSQGRGGSMNRPFDAYGNTAAGIDSKRGDLGQERIYHSQ